MNRPKQAAIQLRPIVRSDIPPLKVVIDATGLFPSEMLDEMMSGYLNGTAPEQMWLTDDATNPKSIAFCSPEKLTSGTWNLYLIAVSPDCQGQGCGAAILRHVERSLADRGERILLVETSSLAEFERTRNFYRNNGYGEEARIRDFYSAGEDKIVFRKVLT